VKIIKNKKPTDTDQKRNIKTEKANAPHLKLSFGIVRPIYNAFRPCE